MPLGNHDPEKDGFFGCTPDFPFRPLVHAMHVDLFPRTISPFRFRHWLRETAGVWLQRQRLQASRLRRRRAACNAISRNTLLTAGEHRLGALLPMCMPLPNPTRMTRPALACTRLPSPVPSTHAPMLARGWVGLSRVSRRRDLDLGLWMGRMHDDTLAVGIHLHCTAQHQLQLRAAVVRQGRAL